MAEDITKPEHVRGIGPTTEGTEIYWFADPTGRVQKVFAPRITREHASQIARDFDWPGARQVPHIQCACATCTVEHK
jgi:hypothetical protein